MSINNDRGIELLWAGRRQRRIEAQQSLDKRKKVTSVLLIVDLDEGASKVPPVEGERLAHEDGDMIGTVRHSEIRAEALPGYLGKIARNVNAEVEAAREAMSARREQRAEAIENAIIALSDAFRCHQMHITPAVGALERALRQALEAMRTDHDGEYDAVKKGASDDRIQFETPGEAIAAGIAALDHDLRLGQ